MTSSPHPGSSLARWQPQRTWRLLSASVWLLASACGPGVATPMPEPPTVFNLDAVGPPRGAGAVSEALGDAEQLSAPSGTVPSGALVRVTNLEDMNPTVVDNAGSDGSFDVSVFVKDGDELRFEWIDGQARSAPADAHFVTLMPSFRLDASPRIDCLQLSPGFVLDFGADASASLALENTCAGPVSLANPRTRLLLPDFALQTAMPLTLAPGEIATLDLTFARGENAAREDILFFDVTLDTTTIRYPITLAAPAVP